MLLGNSQLGFFYTHLVIACKFAMLVVHHQVKGDEPIYQIVDAALQVVKSKVNVAS